MSRATPWEHVNPPQPFADSFDTEPIRRMRVPAGWLVCVGASKDKALTFVPDPEHVWDPSQPDGVKR